VRRRLGERKPFLWYQDGVCFLFVKDGVFQQDVERVSAGDFAPFLWAFIDADTRTTGLPESLATPVLPLHRVPPSQCPLRRLYLYNHHCHRATAAAESVRFAHLSLLVRDVISSLPASHPLHKFRRKRVTD
jgi:hypothetical protein